MISVRDLYFSIAGQPVLRGVSFDIAAGSLVALVGPSGTGKSVLLRHLVGLATPDTGDVVVDGTSITRAGRRRLFELRRRIGFAFQDCALLDSLNVRDNLLLALEDGQLRDATAALACVLDALERVNLGSDVLGKRPAELSGGMRKRVAVARAIIHRPHVLLYDEPTTGLDPRNAALIRQLIRRINDECSGTSFVVTHDFDGLDGFADRVLCLTDGTIVFDGPPAAFFAAMAPATAGPRIPAAR